MNATAGRPSATRGVFAIEEPELLLPDPIALDTSFVVEALIATQPVHPVCSPFLIRIAESGVAITTSDLLPIELAEAVFGIALKERWGSRWRAHRTATVDLRTRGGPPPTPRPRTSPLARAACEVHAFAHAPVADERSRPKTRSRPGSKTTMLPAIKSVSIVARLASRMSTC